MVGEESKTKLQGRDKAEVALKQQVFAHKADDDLGVELGLKETGKDVMGWTILALFLAK